MSYPDGVIDNVKKVLFLHREEINYYCKINHISKIIVAFFLLPINFTVGVFLKQRNINIIETLNILSE